ncbi:hypothetical protein ABK040_005891 [Willaertia magna]
MKKGESIRKIHLDRFARFKSENGFFSDINLGSRLYPIEFNLLESNNIEQIKYYKVEGENKRPLFRTVVSNENQLFKPLQNFIINNDISSFIMEPSWSTHWFKLEFEIPHALVDQAKKLFTPVTIHLLWDSENEAMIYNEDGLPLQGFAGGDYWFKRYDFELGKDLKGGERFTFYMEVSCNSMFGNADPNGPDIRPPNENRKFRLRKVSLGVFDQEAFDLFMDFTIISEMAESLSSDSPRAAKALYISNQIVNVFRVDDRSTWRKAKLLASKFLSKKCDESFEVFASGHCHIDIAWLWPYGETRRKTARSWASQVGLMEKYQEFKFSQSQAQLFEWLKHDYPSLFLKLKEKEEKGQFNIVGGSWVEFCAILTGGESMCRQFLLGQRFFKKEFGKNATEFFLPDSFGYNAQLPQIIKKSGMNRFITQKISWNNINRFPHSTFYWVGLNGDKVLTHFPPADNYCSEMKVKDLVFMQQNFKDKERCDYALALFGFGDGGGGPDKIQIERTKRCENISGLPKLKFASVNEYFNAQEKQLKEEKTEILSWKGELYLEFHRGTYTSQALTKRGNRKGEGLLHDVEFCCVISDIIQKQQIYPYEEIERLWKLLCLNQFHDVLPGSSIGLAYYDALMYYDEIQNSGTHILNNTMNSLTEKDENNGLVVCNTLSWDREEIVKLSNGNVVLINAPKLGICQIKNPSIKKEETIYLQELENEMLVETKLLSVRINKKNGRINVFDKESERECITEGNKLIFYEDAYIFWEAWDIEIFTQEKFMNVENSVESFNVVEHNSLRVGIEIVMNISSTSRLKQVMYINSINKLITFECNCTWNESHKLLKVHFPTDIYNSKLATYEIQFGHIQRPTHENTSWDVAQFENCAQKWVDLSEYNYGVSLLNDCKYGYSCKGNDISLSLLRAPKAPDAECDITFNGKQINHEFKYAILPHCGDFQSSKVIQQAYQLNIPLIVQENAKLSFESYSFIENISKEQVIIESIKKHEDDHNSIILRAYEAFGGKCHCSFTFNSSMIIKKIAECDIIENEIKEIPLMGNSFSACFQAFDIKTFKIVLA